MAADIASGARTAAPRLTVAARRFGDWLTSIGWGKFFLLSLLLLIAGAMINSWLFRGGPAIVVDASDPKERVSVVVSVSPDGVRIAPPAPPEPPPAPEAPSAPAAPAAPDAPQAPAVTGPDSESAPLPAKEAEVKVGKDGVRIVTTKDGKRVILQIDSKGVRVEELAGRAPGAAVGGSSGATTTEPSGEGCRGHRIRPQPD